MKTLNQMKSLLLKQDPTYTVEELDSMSPEQVREAYNEMVKASQHDSESWSWRREHVVVNNL